MREVFPSAPLAMVVAEVRFAYASALESREAKGKALEGLREQVPVLQWATQDTYSFQIGGEEPQSDKQSRDVLVGVSLDRQATVAVSPESLTLSMSGRSYGHFEDSLRPLLEAALESLRVVVPQMFVTRLGLRYLDEIRVPEPPADVSGWSKWVSPELLGGVELFANKVSGVANGMRSTLHYVLPEGRGILVNLGPFYGEGVIGPGHTFYREGPHEHMFIVDVDVSRASPAPEALEPQSVLLQYDELHKPAHSVFSAAVTNEARALFRGNK